MLRGSARRKREPCEVGFEILFNNLELENFFFATEELVSYSVVPVTICR